MTISSFKKWRTHEIVDWVCKYKANPLLQTSYNYETYIAAIDELKTRNLNEEEFDALSKRKTIGEFI